MKHLFVTIIFAVAQAASPDYSHETLLTEQVTMNEEMYDLYKTQWNTLYEYSRKFAEIGKRRFKRNTKFIPDEQVVYIYATHSILAFLTDFRNIDQMWQSVGQVALVTPISESPLDCSDHQGYLLGMTEMITDRIVLVIMSLKNSLTDSIENNPCKTCLGAIHLHSILPELGVWLTLWMNMKEEKFEPFALKYKNECKRIVQCSPEGLISLRKMH